MKDAAKELLQPGDEAFAAQWAAALLVTAKFVDILGAHALGEELARVAHTFGHRGDAGEWSVTMAAS